MRLDHRVALIAAAGALATLAACAKPPPAVDTDKEAAAINAEIAAVNNAFKAKDADKAVAFYADDVTAWESGAPPIKSKSDELEGLKAAMADPNFSFVLTPGATVVAKSGDIATETGGDSGTDTNPTTHKLETLSGNWVAAWRKADDGTWKVTAVAVVESSPMPQPATPKT